MKKRIAIATYLDDNPRLIKEFNWLYESWLRAELYDMSDLVVFFNPTALGKLPKSQLLRYVPVEPLTKIDKLWEDYPFINSIYFMITKEASSVLCNYEYILRTDHDVFLTPYFKFLQPRLAMFGIGMYSQVPNVAIKLNLIAEEWGIIPNHNNVGSTFIAKSDLALQYNQLQLSYCHRLLPYFKDYGKWPGWYKGVLSMYAGNLAANAFFGMNMTLGGLDVHCMSRDKMCPTDYHIHAWHTNDDFSKFKWHNGEYKDLDLSKMNPQIISDYCHIIAGGGPCE